MTNDSTKPSVSQLEAETAIGLIDDWFDPIEAALRDQVRSTAVNTASIATLSAVEICCPDRICMTLRWSGMDSNVQFRAR